MPRLFKQVMRQNLSDYIISKKLNEAVRLLSETAYSVESNGRQLGYKSRKQFHKMFYKYMNLTPSQFRSKHKTDSSNDN